MNSSNDGSDVRRRNDVINVQALRLLARSSGLSISPEFVDGFVLKTKDYFYSCSVRARGNKRNTLMARDL